MMYKDNEGDIIWRGYENNMKKNLLMILHILLSIICSYLSFLNIYFLILAIFFFIIFLTIKRDIFEINTKRLIMIKYTKGFYQINEVELYEIRHIEEKKVKFFDKGYLIFRTNSSLFPEIISPKITNISSVHHQVRDIAEKLKLERETISLQS